MSLFKGLVHNHCRSRVKVTLEIDPEIPTGTPDNVVRTVTEKRPHPQIHQPRLRGRIGFRQEAVVRLEGAMLQISIQFRFAYGRWVTERVGNEAG